MPAARYLFAVVLTGVAVGFGLTRDDPRPAAAPAARQTGVPAEPFGYQFPEHLKYVGNLACASGPCHGGAGTHGGAEYKMWAGGDPHFKAYQVLMNERSDRMVQLLHLNKKAYQEQRCLVCHSPEAAAEGETGRLGVGCESCHGPAERWLNTHYQHEFKRKTPEQRAKEYGYYPTKDLGFRVTMCASCHVGDAGREVDHDLIAAGHPRLAFEYTGYHHSPKYEPFRHWEETAYGPDFDARAWEIGQVACARSAAKLLAARAGESDEHKKRTWPELSEYGCFACHKQVSQDLWTTVTSREGKPGSMPWGRWYFGTVDLAVGQPMKDVEELRHLMELTPDRKPVREAAQRLADRLDVRLRELKVAAETESLTRPYPPSYLSDRLDATIRHALTPDGKQFRDQDWDGVTQHYLGVAAFYYAAGQVSPRSRDSRLRPMLDNLDRSLIYPKGYNSPADTDPGRLFDLFRRLRPVATTRDVHP